MEKEYTPEQFIKRVKEILEEAEIVWEMPTDKDILLERRVIKW